MVKPAESSTLWTVPRIAFGLGVAVFLSVLATIGDPGITVDEPLDVRPGRTYLEALRARGLHFFDRTVVDSVFRDNAEHPPLGRWLLGIASTLGEPFEIQLRGADPVRYRTWSGRISGLYIRSGRLAPAVAFAILVAVVAATAGRRGGRAACAIAGLALAVMPRCFAHAHLAALDTFVALFWVLALLSAARAIEARRPRSAIALAGLVWGLALLTKIHGWLLPPVVAAWAFQRLPWRTAAAAVSAWLATGFALFFAGWPWLWYDTATRLAAYLGTGVARASIRVQYFHQVFADRDVPWHYPWFYFLVTVPVGLHALGALETVRGLRRWRQSLFRKGEQAPSKPGAAPRLETASDGCLPLLLVGAIVYLLSIFSTRVPVYDGERLFLPVFPLWATLIGLGGAAVWQATSRRPPARALLLAALAGQALGVVWLHPFGLSYYNLLVAGLPGAERLGLELTYWGDSVDGVLLSRLARSAEPRQSAALLPTLAPDQGRYATTPEMARVPIILDDDVTALRSDWIVVYRRRAYWRPEITTLLRGRPRSLRSRQGVWLSGLWFKPAHPPVAAGKNASGQIEFRPPIRTILSE